MKSFSLSFGFFIFFIFGFVSPVHAELECEEEDKICSCEKAWSLAFDVMTEHIIEKELAVFLSQNTVAPADMWSAFRSLSLRNRCSLGAVCKVVENGASEQYLDSIFSPANSLGGSFPGEFSACAPDITVRDMFQKVKGGKALLEELKENCSFSDSKSEEKEKSGESEKESVSGSFVQERTEKSIMYSLCREHQDISARIFDRAARNLIWQDVNRKVLGYFSQKLISFAAKIRELQYNAQQFAVNANAAFGMLCTLSNPDT